MEKFKMEYLQLHAIDDALRSGRHPTLKALAALLEKSERSVSRDIQFMRESLRAPIAYDAATRGYYYSEAGFTISDISLDEDESLALFCNGRLSLSLLHGSALYRRVYAGLASLQRRSTRYGGHETASLARHIQFAVHLPTLLLPNPQSEDALLDSFKTGRLLRMRHWVGVQNAEDDFADCELLPLVLAMTERDWVLVYLDGACARGEADVALSAFHAVSTANIRSLSAYKDAHGKPVFAPATVTAGDDNATSAYQTTAFFGEEKPLFAIVGTLSLTVRAVRTRYALSVSFASADDERFFYRRATDDEAPFQQLERL